MQVSGLRGRFSVNGTDFTNGKRDSGTKFPEFSLPFIQSVNRPGCLFKWWTSPVSGSILSCCYYCIETQQSGHFAFITGRYAQIYRTLTSKQPNPQSLLLFVVVSKLFFASFPCAVWIFSLAFCSGSFTTRVVKEYFHLDIARLLCRYFFIVVAYLMTLVALLILFSVLLPLCQLKEAASWLSVLFLVFRYRQLRVLTCYGSQS